MTINKELYPNPQLMANFLNKLFFWWLRSIFFRQKTQNIEIEDFYHVSPVNCSKSLGEKLEKAWLEELTNEQQPSLLRATWRAFGWSFCYYGIHVFAICVILRGLLPYVLGLLIDHFDSRNNDPTIERIYVYAVLFLSMIILQAVIGHHSVFGRKELAMRISIAYSALVYKKTLRLSICGSDKYDTGKIINLLSTDLAKFEDLCMFLHYIWVLPIQGVLMAYFIWDKVGVASLIGMFFLVVQTIPVQGYLARVTGNLRSKLASKTDERISLASEIISHVQFIKLHAWEKPFEKLVSLARKRELSSIAKKSYLRGASAATAAFAESTSLFFLVLAYVLLGNPLQASVLYSMAQYFGMIKTMLTVFYPRALASAAETRVSIQRVQILKGNMDGTSLDRLVTSKSVSVISLDRQTPRLYWADADKIISSDYYGENQKVVYCTPRITSLGVSGNRLFWAQPPDNRTHRNLWTCATQDGVCREQDLLQMPFDYPKSLKVYVGSDKQKENPCAESNGGCQHLCLLTAGSATRYSCACFLGYKLDGDLKACVLVREFLVYARGDLIRGRILEHVDRQAAFSEAIVPIPMKRDIVLVDKPAVDFDYNYYTKSLAYSDDVSIVTANLMNDEPQAMYGRHRCLKDVSFDWVSNDLYYVQDNCRTIEGTSIVLLKPSEERYYAKSLQAFVHENGHPRSVVLDPNTGAYYFAIWLKGVARIYRAHDLKKTLFSKPEWSVNETGLALDAAEGRLYWFSADLRHLHSVHLDKTEEQARSVDVSMIKEPRSVAVFERYAYIANLTTIWRLDKLTGHGLVKIAPRFGDSDVIAGVKVYAEPLQRVDPDNPCAINNGNCQQFCLRVPKYVTSGPNAVNVTDQLAKICLCEDNRELSHLNGLDCV